jgi:hypothetical protein
MTAGKPIAGYIFDQKNVLIRNTVVPILNVYGLNTV